MNRLRLIPVALLVASAAGYRSALACSSTVTSRSRSSVGDPADQMLADAAQKMLGYDTMKFDLIYEKGSTKLYTGIKMTKASGEIQRPGKMRATVQTKVGFVKVNVKATVIGDKAEVRAVGIEEDYTLPGDLAHIIADPVLLLPDVVGAVENPVVTKVETTKKGEQLTWITGTFNPKSHSGRSGARICRAHRRAPGRCRHRRKRADRLGPHSPGRSCRRIRSDVVRRLDIYGFGDPVEIP